MDLQSLLLPFLIGVAVIAVVVAAFPSVFGDNVAKQRQATIKNSGPKRTANERVVDQARGLYDSTTQTRVYHMLRHAAVTSISPIFLSFNK